MKKLMMAVTTLALVAATATAIENEKAKVEPPDIPQASPKVSMLNAAGMDPKLFDEIVDSVAESMRIGIKQLPPVKPFAFETLDAEADALTKFLPSKAYCMVALVTTGKEEKRHGVIHPTDQIGVLNVTQLTPKDGKTETLKVRLKKESIRCVALLAGLPPCPSPRCALWHYTNDAGLDAKGQTLCPPCYLKFDARDRGLAVPAIAQPAKAGDQDD